MRIRLKDDWQIEGCEVRTSYIQLSYQMSMNDSELVGTNDFMIISSFWMCKQHKKQGHMYVSGGVRINFSVHYIFHV